MLTAHSASRSARAALLRVGVLLTMLALWLPRVARAQSPRTPPTLGLGVTNLRGDKETGTGIGGHAHLRWPLAPHLSLIGSVGGIRIGAVERRPTETRAVITARASVFTALTGIETSRSIGTLRPYATLAGGLSLVRSTADVIAFRSPVGQSVPDIPIVNAIAWGTASELAPTLAVGGGMRVHAARGFIIDANLSRFEAGQTTWAKSPGFGAPPDFRRRTSAWLLQVGTAVGIRR